MQLLKSLNRHHHYFRVVIFTGFALPAALLALDYYREALGINPFAELTIRSGFWAFWTLMATLAITPLRRWLRFIASQFKATYGKRLSDWNFLMRSRRMLGLFSLFYSTIHLDVYLYFEMDFYWEDVWRDALERPLIAVGWSAMLIMLVLGLTSPSRVRKAMGRYWRKLHRSVYLLALLAMTHWLMEIKESEPYPWLEIGVLVILLGHRLLAGYADIFKRREDDGMVAHRKGRSRPA